MNHPANIDFRWQAVAKKKRSRLVNNAQREHRLFFRRKTRSRPVLPERVLHHPFATRRRWRPQARGVHA